MGFEILTAMLLNIPISCSVTPCCWVSSFPTTHPKTQKEILITRSTYTYTIIFLHKFSQHFIQFTFLFIFWGHWEVLHFIHHLLALGNIRWIHLWKAWWQIYRCQGAGCSWDHSWSQILRRRVILQIKWHRQNTRVLLMCWWGLQTCNWSYGGGTPGAKKFSHCSRKDTQYWLFGVEIKCMMWCTTDRNLNGGCITKAMTGLRLNPSFRVLSITMHDGYT